MGKIISPAGDQTFHINAVRTDGRGLVLVSRMGVWDAEIHLSYKEITASFLRPKALFAVLKVPVLLLRGLFKRK